MIKYKIHITCNGAKSYNAHLKLSTATDIWTWYLKCFINCQDTEQYMWRAMTFCAQMR